MGLDKATWLALDVEAPDLPQKCTAGINKFLGYLYANGYHNLMVYGSTSWFKEGRINQAKLHKYAKLWVAAYGTSQPGINHVDIWQYTDRFKGMSLDASYDFKNLLKSNGKSDTPIKPSYYASKIRLFCSRKYLLLSSTLFSVSVILLLRSVIRRS